MKSDFPSAMRSTDNTDHFGFNNQLQKPLRASIKDGYTQIPNLLLEALCCAPLAASEFHIVMLFIRLSFGWFDRETRSRKKPHVSAPGRSLKLLECRLQPCAMPCVVFGTTR